MQRFITYLFFFFFPVLLLAGVAEILMRKMPNDYTIKKSFLDQNASKINVLILGSSHAFAGLDPAFMGVSCFNASYDSQTLEYDLWLFKKYRDQLISLKFLVIPVSYFSMALNMETGPEPWRSRFYYLYYDIKARDKLTDRSEILGGNLRLSLHKLFNYYLLHKNGIHTSALGRGTEYTFKNRLSRIETGPVSAKRHTCDNPKVFDEMANCLEQIIKIAAEKNIKVILHTSPALPYYVNNLNQMQLTKTLQKLASLDQKYENVRYINFLQNHPLQDSDFYDADHLNETGSVKFSKMIAKCLTMK